MDEIKVNIVEQENDEQQFQNDEILLNTFLINKKKYRVLMHYDVLIWEKENTKNEKVTIPIIDIITVKRTSSQQQIRKSPTNNAQISLITDTNHQESSRTTTTTTTTPITNNNDNIILNNKQYLIIYYCTRIEKSHTDYNRWCSNKIKFFNNDQKLIDKWFYKINDLLLKIKRPKHILLFINPFGGRKNAMKIYEKYAKPLFQLANCDVNCIISQRSNQIHDILLQQSLQQYDCICCIGGDGTFSEVFNGLIYRQMKDLKMNLLRPDYIPKPKLPIGIIPGGSTDTIAYCLHGTIDIRTSVIHIILGQTRGLDISSVCNNNGLIRLYASIMSYGYLGDVALDSEQFRWMGPKRYDYSGFKKILANRPYEGEVIMLTSDNENNELPKHNNDNNDITIISNNSNNNKNSNSINMIVKEKCFMNCTICSKSLKNILLLENNDNDNEQRQQQQNNEQNNDETNRNENNKIDYYLLAPNYQQQISIKKNYHKWKTIKGKFFMISGANISCACARSPNGFAPYCHLGDGHIYIILIHHTTVYNNIRLLLNLIKRNNDIDDLPFVDIYRTRKFYFRTLKPQQEITIDTEINGNNDEQNDEDETNSIRIENHHQQQHHICSSPDDLDENFLNIPHSGNYSINGSCQPINTEYDDRKFSQWNCDGDVIHDTDVLVSSHCQLIDVFTRGPYPETEINIPSKCGGRFCKT